MHSVLEQVTTFLKSIPEIPFEIKEDKEILVETKSQVGYPVKIVMIDELTFELHLSSWYREFTATDTNETQEALNYFKLALTRNFRIKEFARANIPYKWVLEYKTPEGWEFDSGNSKLNLRMWKGRTIKYLQNDWFQLT